MTRRHLPALLTVLALAAGVSAQQPFDPARHLAGPGSAVLEVSSVAALRAGFTSTLPGALLMHPDTRAGTTVLEAALRERVDELVHPLEGLARAGLDDVERLLSGGFTLAVGELSPDGPPQLVLALPATNGADDLAMVGRLLGLAFPGDVGEAEALGELTITPLPGPAGPLASSLIGDHIVLATDPGSLQLAHALWKTNAEPESLAATPAHQALSAALGPRGSGLRLAVDLASLRETLLGWADERGDGERVRRNQAETGLDRVEAFGLQVGFRDGGLAKTLHLGLRGSGDAALDAFRACLLPVRRVDEALAILPSAAHEVSAFRIAPAATYEALAARFPDELADVRAALAELEVNEELGWTPAGLFDRLPSLGDIEVFSFAVDPPAGGLFADRVHLVRSDELEPYWRLVLELVSGLDPGLGEREVGGARLVSLDLVQAAQGKQVLGQLLRGAGFDDLSDKAQIGFSLPFLLPAGNLVRADIPGGWTVVSSSSHAVSRFLVLGPSSEPMSSNAQASQRVRQVLGGAVMGSVFDTGESVLAGYNTLLALGDQLAPALALLGVEVGRLPPAEAFLRMTGMGYVRVVSNEQGITLWSHRAGVPSIVAGLAASLWLGLASVGTASSVVLPGVMERLEAGKLITTQARIHNLRQVIMMYRMRHGALPESLETLLEPSEKDPGEPYVVDADMLLDGWGETLEYRVLDERRFELVSAGAEAAGAGVEVSPDDR